MTSLCSPKFQNFVSDVSLQLAFLLLLLLAESSEQAPSQDSSEQICRPKFWDTCPSIYRSLECFGTNRTIVPGEAIRLSSGSDLRRGCKWIFTSQVDSSFQCCYGNTDQCERFESHKRCRGKEDPSSVLVKVEGTRCSLQICDITQEDEGSYQSIYLGVQASENQYRTTFFISIQENKSNLILAVSLSIVLPLVVFLLGLLVMIKNYMNKFSNTNLQENGSKKDPPLKFKVKSIEVLESQGLLVQKDHLTSYILF